MTIKNYITGIEYSMHELIYDVNYVVHEEQSSDCVIYL